MCLFSVVDENIGINQSGGPQITHRVCSTDLPQLLILDMMLWC